MDRDAAYVHVLGSPGSRIRGGGDALVGALERRFRQLGGTVLTGRGAERLRVDGKYARALEFSDGAALDLDLLIATCHPLETLRFCGRDRFSPAFVEAVDAAAGRKQSTNHGRRQSAGREIRK
jgi:phytoene dehydrogenase-like protein